MRIDRLRISNFKKFSQQDFSFHPHFTLLVGENGSGKTSVLDALAVSLGIWLVNIPDSDLASSRRNILPSEVRLEATRIGDRIQFRECLPVWVESQGSIAGRDAVSWVRQIREGGKRTTNLESREALELIDTVYQRDQKGEHILCPVLAYYGAGRAWLPSNRRTQEARHNGPPRRWAAFYDCFNERIRFDELRHWFHRETTAAGARGGRMRPGFKVVERAVIQAVQGADGLWYDADRDQIVLSIQGASQPFDNLSAGQRMMLALSADIAIKAVTQNAFLLAQDDPGAVLARTPGVVLIDELDVHLHPRWQRQVAADLKRTFANLQFVCTSHSPQVIGELPREEIRILGEDGVTGPCVARGADSNWLLDHVMQGARSENAEARQLRDAAEEALGEGRLDEAEAKLREYRALLDGETGELVRLEGSLYALRCLAEEDCAP